MTDREAYVSCSGLLDLARGQEIRNTVGGLIGKVEVLRMGVSISGGYVMEGISLYNQIRGAGFKRVIAHNLGAVGSAGVPLFLAADERYASRTSVFLLHCCTADTPTPNDVTRFSAREIREQLEILTACDDLVIQVLLGAGQVRKSGAGRADPLSWHRAVQPGGGAE